MNERYSDNRISGIFSTFLKAISSGGTPRVQLIAASIIVTIFIFPAQLALGQSFRRTCKKESSGDLSYGPKWKWEYINERSTHQHNIIVADDTVDERLANIVIVDKALGPIDVNFHKYNTGDKEYDKQIATTMVSSEVNDTKCAINLHEMIKQMDDMASILANRRLNNSNLKVLDKKHLLLAHVLDSFGRYESGTLMGKGFILGSYSECVGGQLYLASDFAGSKPELISMRYCFAKFDLRKYLHPTMNHEAENAFISVGICIPESCHSRIFPKYKHLLQNIIDTQFKLPQSIFVEKYLNMNDLFCPVDSKSASIPFPGKALLLFIVIWIITVVRVTVINRFQTGKSKSRASEALDLCNSWKQFAGPDTQTPNERVSLHGMAIFKVISCFAVILGHCCLVVSLFSSNTIKLYADVEFSAVINFIFGSTIITDTFYTITGITLSYIALKRLGPSKSFDLRRFFKLWLTFTGGRYLRLLPMYYLVFWFKKTIFISLPYGPLSDSGYNKETPGGACKNESWLSPLTSGSAYLPLGKQCMPHAWTIAGDLITSIILGPIILLMKQRPKIGIALGISLTLMSNFMMFRDLTNSLLEPHYSDFQDIKPHSISHFFKFHSFYYSAPHYRCCSILIGAVAGYFLYRYDLDKTTVWPNWFKGVATRVAMFTCLIIILAPASAALNKHNLVEKYPFHRAIVIHAITSVRLVWVICNSIILLRSATDWNNSRFGRFSSNGLFRAWTRLNYLILLVHLDSLLAYLHQRTSLIDFSINELFVICFTIYLFCCIVAVPLYVIFEYPIDKLTKAMLPLSASSPEAVRDHQSEDQVKFKVN